MGRNLPANAGDTGLIPGLGRVHRPQSNKAHELQLRSKAAKYISIRKINKINLLYSVIYF